MSDWDFLHEMHDRGYSAEEIVDAAGAGYAPWDEAYLSKEWIAAEFEDQLPEDASSLEPRESFRSRGGFPYSVLEQTEIFGSLVDCAERHFRNTGRYLQLWGELGEIYAEIKFGLCRHATHQAGSDGTIREGQRPCARQASRRFRAVANRPHRRSLPVHGQAN
jgi:hypothetical protein